MRIFVRTLFAKLFLLGLLAVPLVLFGLNEAKQLTEAGIANSRNSPPPPSDTELKQIQEESAKLASMPSDLRREMLFPGGRITNDAGPPFLELSKAVRNRAGILAAHRQFLLQYNSPTNTETTLKVDPAIVASIGKDLKQHYEEQLKDRRDQSVLQFRLEDLKAQLAKADAKTLPDLAKEINSAIDDFGKRWPEKKKDTIALRDELTQRELAFASDATERERIVVDAAWKRVMQLPSAEIIRSTQGQIDGLMQKLRTLVDEAKTQKDDKRQKWAADMLVLWSNRRDFLPDALTLLESMDRALAEGRVDDFFTGCKKVIANHPPITEAKGLVRGAAEDFCTRYLVKQPMDPVKYDEVVILIGLDKALHSVPRRQVKVYFKNEERRFMENGDPLKNDGFTEFHAEKMKDDIRHLTVFDADRKDTLPGGLLTQIEFKKAELRPTPRSAAVRFYCDEYRKVDRWNATAVRDFVKKCEPHKDYLGEIWNRLNAMDKAMNSARELFADAPQ